MKNRDNEVSKASSTAARRTRSVGADTTSGRNAKRMRPGPQGGASVAMTLLTYEQVAERARAIWLASGCTPGRDEQNWQEAEIQLKTELKSLMHSPRTL